MLASVGALIRGEIARPAGASGPSGPAFAPGSGPAPADAPPEPNPLEGLADPAAQAAKPPAPNSLAALAERLGVDPASLYDIEIPTGDGDGSAIKLGELKDAHRSRLTHEAEKLSWAEQREADAADTRRARAELTELLGAVPRDKLNPQVIEAARASHQARMETERQRVMTLIPAWQDAATREADLTGIRAMMADFGLPASALSEVQDARMLALLQSAADRKQRVERALAQVKPARAGTGPERSTTQPPTQPRRPSGSTNARSQQASAISDLLRSLDK